MKFVNALGYTVETGYMLTLSTCSIHQPPRSQDCEKLGGGVAGNEATHSSGHTGESCYPNVSTRA